jgi:hypothetical protein
MRRRDTALLYEMADVALKSLGSAAALVQMPVGGNVDSWTTCAMHLVADASHRAAPSHGVLAVRVDAPGSSAPLWHAVAPAKCDVRIDVLGSYVCAFLLGHESCSGLAVSRDGTVLYVAGAQFTCSLFQRAP